eukprot:scaffold77342_cov21-Tisochrysis_lutea.AAC.5
MVPYHLHESDELSPQRESVSGLGKNSRAPGTGGDKQLSGQTCTLLGFPRANGYNLIEYPCSR